MTPNSNQEEKEWWRAYTQLLHFADGSVEVNVHEKDIPAIIHEAERRTWEEAKNALSAFTSTDHLRKDYNCSCMHKVKTCGCVVEDYNEALDDLEKKMNEFIDEELKSLS